MGNTGTSDGNSTAVQCPSKSDQEVLDEAKELTYETFRVGMERLLNLCIEGYPRAVRSTNAKRNQLLREHGGNQDAAIAELKGLATSIKDDIKEWLLGVVKYVKLPAAVVLPTWKLMRRVCLIAGLYGHDLNSEETRARILNAFSDNKAASLGKYTVEAAIQAIWKSFAGPVARIVPIGKVFADLANVEEKILSGMGCDMFSQDRKQIGPEIYNETLDPSPTARDIFELGKDGAQYALVSAWTTSLEAVAIARDPDARATTMETVITSCKKAGDITLAAARTAPGAAKSAAHSAPDAARETIDWAKSKIAGATSGAPATGASPK